MFVYHWLVFNHCIVHVDISQMNSVYAMLLKTLIVLTKEYYNVQWINDTNFILIDPKFSFPKKKRSSIMRMIDRLYIDSTIWIHDDFKLLNINNNNQWFCQLSDLIDNWTNIHFIKKVILFSIYNQIDHQNQIELQYKILKMFAKYFDGCIDERKKLSIYISSSQSDEKLSLIWHVKQTHFAIVLHAA